MFDLTTTIQVLAQAELVIDWENLPTYNTIMSLAAGAGLILLVRLARDVLREPSRISAEGYALSFGVLGAVLVTTGLHMTLTWPLAPDFPYDNIIFGEPALLFGVMLSAVAFYGWRRGAAVLESTDLEARVGKLARPMKPTSSVLGCRCWQWLLQGCPTNSSRLLRRSRSAAGSLGCIRGWNRRSSRDSTH